MNILAIVILVMITINSVKYFQDITIGNDVLEIYYSIIGSIYAIIVGFVLLIVVSNFNVIRRNVFSEVNAIQDFRDLIDLVSGNDEVKSKTSIALVSYAKSVSIEKNVLLSGSNICSDTSKELYIVLDLIKQIKPASQTDKIAIKALVRSFTEITTFRTNRISSTFERVPKIMMHLIFFLTMCIIFPLIFLETKFFVWAVVNTLVSISVLYIYLIIRDLNEPLSGFWNISFEEYESLDLSTNSLHVDGTDLPK